MPINEAQLKQHYKELLAEAEGDVALVKKVIQEAINDLDGDQPDLKEAFDAVADGFKYEPEADAVYEGDGGNPLQFEPEDNEPLNGPIPEDPVMAEHAGGILGEGEDGQVKLYADEEGDDEEFLAELKPAPGNEWVVHDVGGVAPPIQVQNEPQVQANVYVAGNNHKNKLNAAKFHQAGLLNGVPPPIQPQPYDGMQCAGSSVAPPQHGLKGLMIFYINTGNLAAGPALDMIDKVKMQYRTTELALRNQQIEVMWMPRTYGKTCAEFFPFR